MNETLALAPFASVPRLQTTSGAPYKHEPWLGTAPTYSTPAGSGIVSVTLGVASGPLFLTVNERSACCPSARSPGRPGRDREIRVGGQEPEHERVRQAEVTPPNDAMPAQRSVCAAGAPQFGSPSE